MFKRKVRNIDGIFRMMTETDTEHMRADTFYTKEPETVFWYHCMDKHTPIIDVGANIGVYSLYAAGLNGTRKIYAFEPMRDNFLRLCQNIKLNGFSNVIPLNIALGAENGLDTFFIPDGEIGSSGGQIKSPIDDKGDVFNPVATQTVQTMRLTRFMHHIYKPDVYLKVDVDGREMEVLDGLDELGCLVKSCLIEVNKDITDIKVLDALMGAWGLKPDRRFNNFKPHSSDRRGGNPINIVYSRRKND